MNVVTISRILELSEKRSRFYRLKLMISNYKAVVFVSIAALTLKSIAEQIVMAIR